MPTQTAPIETKPAGAALPPGVQAAPGVELPTTVIVPDSETMPLRLGELWHYRDLLLLLIWRDISARYRQSVAGYGWAILRPLLSMLVFVFIFGTVVKLDTGDTPYILYAFTGLLPWLYFSTALSSASTSVVSGSALVQKVYFPRLILPLASVVGGLVELAIQFVALALLMAVYGVWPTVSILAAPLFVLALVVCALAGGIWLTALNVRYRDIGMALPFLIQAWMWFSPVAYPSSLIPEKFRLAYGLNPITGIIEGFRWSLLGTESPDWGMMAVSLTVVAVLLVTGTYYFRRAESEFADII